MGDPQLLACVEAPALTSQPLAVEQVSAREVQREGASVPDDRSPRGRASRLLRRRRASARERASMPSAHGVPLARVDSLSTSSASAARSLRPLRLAASISSTRAKVENQSSCGSAAACVGGVERIVVARQAVVEHGGHPLRHREPHPLAASDEVVRGAPTKRVSSSSRPRKAASASAPYGGTMRPSVASASASACSTSDAAARISPAKRWTPTRVLNASGRCASAPASRAARIWRSREGVPAFVVPDESCGPAGEPQPAQTFFGADLVAVERDQCAFATSAFRPRAPR